MSIIEALEAVRERAGGEGGRANLADVGNWLKEEGVGSGGMKLSDFLRGMPEFCKVEAGTVVFGGGDPRVEVLEDRPRQRLHPALYHALTRDRPGETHWMHLKTYDVVRVGMEDDQPGPPVSDAEFEYVLIPTISIADQKAFAREFLATKMDDEALAYIFAPDDGSWIQRGRRTAPPEIWSEFWAQRREWVVQRGIDLAQGPPLSDREFRSPH